jgi:2-phospho-L-lactate guanylyltransferase
VLAPDRHRRGTNVLAIQHDVPFEPAFGVNSLALHRREAQRLGLIVREYRSRGTGFDVDTVEDLREYQRSQQAMTEGRARLHQAI